MFVLLHLRAAVIDELQSPQAAHLLIHTQVLRHAKRGGSRSKSAQRAPFAVKQTYLKQSQARFQTTNQALCGPAATNMLKAPKEISKETKMRSGVLRWLTATQLLKKC